MPCSTLGLALIVFKNKRRCTDRGCQGKWHFEPAQVRQVAMGLFRPERKLRETTCRSPSPWSVFRAPRLEAT